MRQFTPVVDMRHMLTLTACVCECPHEHSLQHNVKHIHQFICYGYFVTLCLSLPMSHQVGSVLSELYPGATHQPHKQRWLRHHSPSPRVPSCQKYSITHSQLVSLRLLFSVCRLDRPPCPPVIVTTIPPLLLLMLLINPSTHIAHLPFSFRLSNILRFLILHLLPLPLAVATLIFLLLLLPSPLFLFRLALLLLPCCCRFLQSLQMYLQGKKGGGMG